MSFVKSYVQKLVPLDEDEKRHRIELERTYRDRAEERRQQEPEPIVEEAQIEGEGVAIKLKGLDLDLLKKEQEEIQRKEQAALKREADLAKLRMLKESGKLTLLVPKPAPQKLQGSMAVKLTNFIANRHPPMMQLKNMQTYYQFDMHRAFPKQLPEIVTKKFEDIEKENQYIFPRIDVLDEFGRFFIATEGLSRPRNQARPVALDRHQSDSDDIFADAKLENQEQQKQAEIEELEQALFDPQEYLQGLKEDEEMLNEQYNEQYKEQLEQRDKVDKEKMKKHQKMLQEEEDYYIECFQPNNLAQIDPSEIPDKPGKGGKFGKGKFAKGKPKRKRENFDKQFEQIEQIIKKNKQ